MNEHVINSTDKWEHEISHGKFLADNDPETIWGWGTPAGRVRAVRRAKMISEGAGLAAGKKVLEIGCGTGLFTSMFADSGAEIYAVDISNDLLERARTRGLPEDRIHFVHKNFQDCGDKGPFDAVIGSSILHHLEIPKAIKIINDLLKSGGVMCFTEPNMLNPQIMVQKNIPWIKKMAGDSPDETAFIRFSFAKVLEGCGFSKTEIIPFDWLHPATPEGMVKGVKGFGDFLESVPLIREIAGSVFIKAWKA